MRRAGWAAGVGMAMSLGAPWLMAASSAPGMVLYRYVDSRGVTVLDRQGVPTEYVGKGYQILNQQGRVIQSVPPAPTAEEQRRNQEAQARADADAQLLYMYPSLNELDRARDRKLAELDAQAAVNVTNIQALQRQQAAVQAQAADQERAGRDVPQALLDQLRDLASERTVLDARTQDFQKKRVQVGQEFSGARTRLMQILTPSP